MHRRIVEIVMDTNQLLEKFKEKLYEEQANVPYNFNILDEQVGNIVENSHTNILMKILQYKNQYGYIFLENFFSFLGLDVKVNPDYKVMFDKEKNYEKKGRIDGLIFQKDQFAIIIENKVNGAGNQKDQLKKYIEAVLGDDKKFPNVSDPNNKSKIWVLFLTRDGIEKPDCESVKFMRELGICDTPDDEEKEIDGPRYAAINYQEHILPWLKEEIQPIVMHKEQVLNTGLLQYIDHLEGMFGLRQSDAKLINEGKVWIIKWLKENYDIDNISKNFKKVNDKLDDIKKGISNQLKEFEKKGIEDIADKWQYAGLLFNIFDEINDEPMKYFFDITRNYFESNGLMDKCVISHVFNYSYIQIRDASWPRSIHFEWNPLGVKRMTSNNMNIKFTFCFHVEGAKEIRESFKEDDQLNDYFQQESVKFEKKEYSRVLSFYKVIETNNSNPFLNNELETFLKKDVYSYVTPDLIEMIKKQIESTKTL